MISLSLPRSRKTWGWSNGGLAPTHMNSCEPISITETPASLWKCGTTWSDIILTLDGNDGRTQSTRCGSAKCRAPYWREQLIPRAPTAHLLMQIRHNLVVPEKPFFRRGRCVRKAAHHLEGSEDIGVFGMKRMRIGSALVGTTVCAVACALLWPHARDAGAILAAQDDPAALSDIQLNSALRDNQPVIAAN